MKLSALKALIKEEIKRSLTEAPATSNKTSYDHELVKWMDSIKWTPQNTPSIKRTVSLVTALNNPEHTLHARAKKMFTDKQTQLRAKYGRPKPNTSQSLDFPTRAANARKELNSWLKKTNPSKSEKAQKIKDLTKKHGVPDTRWQNPNF